MYTTIWIEGEENLNAFCLKRFKEEPRFVETIGKAGTAKIILKYKFREDKQRYTAMYLLFMEHPKGNVADPSDISNQSYEQIRANRTSILVR